MKRRNQSDNEVHIPPRGRAPVGDITELQALKASAVIYLRLWCDSLETQQQTRQSFELALGVDAGRRASAAMAQLCDMCANHGHRPLMRHQLWCKCLGGDESCFTNFVAAAIGHREDAFIFAQNIVQPDMVMCLIDLAQNVGLSLKRIGVRGKSIPCPTFTPSSKTLH